MKKKIATLAAAAVLSSAFGAAASASADTYTVQKGDSFYRLAIKFNTNVAELKRLNGLHSDFLSINQLLKVSEDAAAVAEPSQPAPAVTVPSAPVSAPAVTVTPAKTYTVVKGDTLSKIARNFGKTVGEIKSLNGLSSDLIRIGQVLKVSVEAPVSNTDTTAPAPPANNTTVQTPPAPAPVQAESPVVAAAKSLLGTRYVYGGSSLSGFDCSGFIYYVFNLTGKKMGRYSSDGYYNRSYYVNNPQPGDLVFFENTYKRGISHMGIYLGNNQFIHASDSGVAISSLSNTYYKQHFDSFKRFY